MLLTTALRAEIGPSVWGNWTLSRAVEPGMVGVVDPVAGTFELHKRGAIPLDVRVVEYVAPSTWAHQSATVSHSVEQAAGGEVDRWTFEESHTIVSRGTQHSRRVVDDPVAAAHEHLGLVQRWADARGYATCGGIIQGFGIVTATYEATQVLNLASRAAGQSFVAGREVDDRGGVEAFVHPPAVDRGSTAEPATVAYAFEFMSFSGRTPLPGWVGQIPAVSISFLNSGSYVVQCTVDYDTPDARNLRKRVQVGGGIPGWVSLPVETTNVRVTCRFWHVDDWGPRCVLPPVVSPVQEWWQGQGVVDIQGWWPGEYDVRWAASTGPEPGGHLGPASRTSAYGG
jgi:hypothetical protein